MDEDSLVKEETLYVNDAIFDDRCESTNVCEQKVTFEVSEDESIIRIVICKRVYVIDLKRETVKGNKKLESIVSDLADLCEMLR